MADTTSKELQAKQKTEVSTPAEQTIPGTVFVPAVDIVITSYSIHYTKLYESHHAFQIF